MVIIYIPKILKHWFTGSLYDTPTFQKLWHVIDFIFFRNLYTSMAKQTPAIIPMMGEETVVTKFAFLLIWNFVINFTILKSSWVLANHLCYLNVNFISSSIWKQKRVCFGIKLYKLTSSNSTTLNISVNSRKRIFHNGDEINDMSAPERTPFYQIFFFLLVTPDIFQVTMMQLKDYHLSGTFPKRSYRKELAYVLLRSFLLNTS